MTSDPRLALLQARARHMLHHPTAGERAFFAAVRGQRLGVVVKRQLVIGRSIVDFLLPSARLIVELDGAYHEGRSAADQRRDAVLRRMGYRVLRFEEEAVRRDVATVLERVRFELSFT